jgi:single-strand DNA-binding protein
MVNLAVITGRIGQEPIIRTLDNGKTVASFSVATSEKWKNKSGEVVEKTEWHNVSCWDKQAEFVEKWAKKGLIISVTGKITHTEYEGKDGIKRQKYEIQAEKVVMITWPEKDTTESQSRSNGPQNASTGVYDQNSRGDGPSKSQPAYQKEEDDLPF